MQSSTTSQERVIAFLLDPASYPHPVLAVHHIETHISHVFLTGPFAYKLKKAVNLGFANFVALDRRKFFCEEEVRLNSRYSAELYVATKAISQIGELIVFGEGECALDYVVQMKQFEEKDLFLSLLSRGELTNSLLAEATGKIAAFHRGAGLSPSFGGSESLDAAIREVFGPFAFLSPSLANESDLQDLQSAVVSELATRTALIERRRSSHVRAIHGDLHLKNICVFAGSVYLFDGIEFNPSLSQGDVWSDIAFLIMDLIARGKREQATLVCNHYLEHSDDFAGLALLPLFVSYRAGVRAKVSLLTADSARLENEKNALLRDVENYLALAKNALVSAQAPAVLAIGGLSGSGKSTLAEALALRSEAIHVRADAIRKHLLGIPLQAKAPHNAYSAEMNKRTFQGMLARADHALQAGRTVIFDSVFHSAETRRRVAGYARERGATFRGLWCSVPEEIAKQRIQSRDNDVSDADEAIRTLQRTYDVGAMDWEIVDTSGQMADIVNFVLSLR